MAVFTGNVFEMQAQSNAPARTPHPINPPPVEQANAQPIQGRIPVMQPIPVRAPDTTGLINQNNTLWSNAGNPLGAQAEGVMQDMMSGNTYNAYAIQNREALGRAEANQRASTAAQIHQAGFSGTPLGAGAGNATEGTILRNRFDTNLGIETARQNMRERGMNTAFGYADQANRFAMDQERLGIEKDRFGLEKDRFAQEQTANQQALYNAAGQSMAADFETHRFEYAQLGIESMADTDFESLRQSAPTLVHNAQNRWTAMGNEGDVPLWFIQSEYKSLSNPVYGNQLLQAENMFKEFGMSEEQAKAYATFMAEGLLQYNPETGKVEINQEMLDALNKNDAAAKNDSRSHSAASQEQPPTSILPTDRILLPPSSDDNKNKPVIIELEPGQTPPPTAQRTGARR